VTVRWLGEVAARALICPRCLKMRSVPQSSQLPPRGLPGSLVSWSSAWRLSPSLCRAFTLACRVARLPPLPGLLFVGLAVFLSTLALVSDLCSYPVSEILSIFTALCSWIHICLEVFSPITHEGLGVYSQKPTFSCHQLVMNYCHG
jgi:hypothetical protein